jgi:glycosyltransferase involved in cell wall biosynthesis
MLIAAFEQVETAVKLVLAGGSSHSDSYVAQIRQHAGERIKILDWLSGEAFEEVLTNSALFVLPSDMEGMSLSLLEAMGAGVCVLVSDTPENREAIAECGFTFKAGDVNDLRRMLTLLLDQPELRRNAAQKARLRVQEQYAWDRIAQQIEATYCEVLADRACSVSATAKPMTSRVSTVMKKSA